MKTKQLKTVEAEDQYKWVAWRDAHLRSEVNKTRFGPGKQLAGERMKMALEMLYDCKEVFLVFRKTFISVKVDQPVGVIDKAELKAMEDEWDKKGYTKKLSPQGVTYTIPR